MEQRKMYTLAEALALVGNRSRAIKAELKKSHGYLPADDLYIIARAIVMAAYNPEGAARYLERQDTIVREAAVESILAVTGGGAQ